MLCSLSSGTRRGLCQWPDVCESRRRVCRQVGARLLAIDTLGNFIGLHGDSENNSCEAMRAMQPLQEVIASGQPGCYFQSSRAEEW